MESCINTESEERAEKPGNTKKLISRCGSCGKEAPKKEIVFPDGVAAEIYDDFCPCPCGGVYHRNYG